MKKNTLKSIAWLCLLCLTALVVVAFSMYYKPHRSAATEAALPVPATRLSKEYEADEAASDKKYLGKALQVTGTVSEIALNRQNIRFVVLAGTAGSGVQCNFQSNTSNFKMGDTITVKGFCTGFLSDVIMDRCIHIQ